jgi:hypothetical protein
LAALGVCAVAKGDAISINNAKAKPGTVKLDLRLDEGPALRLRCGSGLRACKSLIFIIMSIKLKNHQLGLANVPDW